VTGAITAGTTPEGAAFESPQQRPLWRGDGDGDGDGDYGLFLAKVLG
jgi:hypothetical protein